MNYKQNHRQELSDDSSHLLFPLDTEFEGNSEESDTSMGHHPPSHVFLATSCDVINLYHLIPMAVVH